MTESVQRPNSAPDNEPVKTDEIYSGSLAPGSSVRPIMDSASDNESSERPVREKLKKTSIAAIPKNGLLHSQLDVGIEEQNKMDQIEPVEHPEGYTLPDKNIDGVINGDRGRLLRKRSFDDSEAGGLEDPGKEEVFDGKTSTHMRKRSRDVLVTNLSEPIECSNPPLEALVQESEDHNITIDETVLLDEGYLSVNIQNKAKGTELEPVDQDMKDSITSPRKKRSRDQLEADIDREQKIVATEEAKAHRRSEEIERDELPEELIDKSTLVKGSVQPQDAAYGDRVRRLDAASVKSLPKNNIRSASADSLSSMLAQPGDSRSPSRASNMEPKQSQAPATFASSGFAALSGSSISPFAAIGSSSTVNQFNISGSKAAAKTSDSDSMTPAANTPFHNVNSVLSAETSLKPQGFGGIGSAGSDSVSSQPPSFSSFGGSTFGSGFGSAFVGGPKLSSFAAPVGDAKLGDSVGIIGSFGAPSKDEEEEENSGSEETGMGELDGREESEDTNGRFQQQEVGTGEDGEMSIFSSPRVNLYSWNGDAWKEGGRGTFKLNVTIPGPDDDVSPAQRSGRFIMRAHQTYRVLLNTPIFKQMKIGDIKGNEPTGKTLAFSVIENGKPTPYLIKMSDDEESKALYHEVRKLQQAL